MFVVNKEMTKKFNLIVDKECKKVSSIDDIMYPYSVFEKELNNESFKLIKDKLLKDNFTNCFIVDFDFEFKLEQCVENVKVKELEPFGICDNASQVIKHLNGKVDMDNCIIGLVPIVKKLESDESFEWDDLGEYIGVQDKREKYLKQEENIDFIYCFNVYEIEKVV